MLGIVKFKVIRLKSFLIPNLFHRPPVQKDGKKWKFDTLINAHFYTYRLFILHEVKFDMIIEISNSVKSFSESFHLFMKKSRNANGKVHLNSLIRVDWLEVDLQYKFYHCDTRLCNNYF